MKRLIIDGDWREEPPGYWHLSRGDLTMATCGPGANATIEDIPDPLPTEPGVRFWGSYDKTKPCWWFVMADKRDGGGVRYVSQYGIGDGHPSGIHSTSTSADRLVHLPDPA